MTDQMIWTRIESAAYTTKGFKGTYVMRARDTTDDVIVDLYLNDRVLVRDCIGYADAVDAAEEAELGPELECISQRRILG
jgi:hypothetical protein